MILGETYFTPYVLGQPYTTLSGADGNKKIYHCLYLIGYKDIVVNKASIGTKEVSTTPTESGNLPLVSANVFQNLQLELKQGANPVSIYNEKVVQENFNVELITLNTTYGTKRGVYAYAFSARYPRIIELEISIPGLYQVSTSGEDAGQRKKGSLQLSFEYSKDGGSNWTKFNSDIVIPYGSTTEISYGDWGVQFQNNSTTELRFVVRKTFDATFMAGCESKVVMFRVSRVDSCAYLNNSNYNDRSYFTAIRTWCYDPASEETGTLQPQIPMAIKERDKTARLGISVEVTEDLVNQFDKLNLIVASKARTWDSTNHGWTKTKSVTRNPAAIALNVMIGDYLDQKYRHNYDDTGAGNFITSNKIDLQSFGEAYEYFAQTKSFGGDPEITAPRYLCDGAVVNRTKKIDLVNNILGVARSFIVMNGKKYGVFVDKERSVPLLNLNHNNLLELVLTKTYDEVPDGQRVKYVSAINYYQADTMDVKPYSENNNEVLSTDVLENVEMPYITDPYHAKAMSLYLQACKKLRPETLQAKVTSEGALAEIGCLITVQSPIISVGIGEGAEIIEIIGSDNNVTGIKVDAKFPVVDASKTYGVVINVVDNLGQGKILKKELDSFASVGEYSTLTFETVDTTGLIQEGCIVSFGIYGTETLEVICVGKKENGDGTYDLTLVPYDEQVYQADSHIIHDFNPMVTPPNDAGALIEYGNRQIPVTLADVIDTIGIARDDSAPEVPVITGVKATQDYIKIDWTTTNNDFVKEAVIELSRDNGTTWEVVQRIKAKTWSYYFNRASQVDGYPEASDLANYKFRMKNVSIYGVESAYCDAQGVSTIGYKTWLVGNISVDTEIVDRTIILTVVCQNEVYGNLHTLIRIKRLGNTEEVSSGNTFNSYLGITPDSNYATPDFASSYMPSATEDTEGNYKTNETSSYVHHSNKITHTVPLIGQTARLFDSSNKLVDFSFNAQEITVFEKISTEPSSVVLKKMILFDGTTTASFTNGKYYIGKSVEGTNTWVEVVVDDLIHYTNINDYVENDNVVFASNGYYQFSTTWDIVYSRTCAVPTEYQYEIKMRSESGSLSVNTEEPVVKALPTNIADIVRSHDRYKNLYVEKLSAINANIGLISQGGMGSFADQLNYWALSDLNPEDSGVAGGVKKGAFRVGGQNEYFKVTPLGNDEYKIELKAGNIELTSSTGGGSGMDFLKGTFVYSADKLQRLALTPEGILIQQYTGSTPSNPSPTDYATTSQVTVNKNNDLIIANTDQTPEFGYQISGADVYHFDGTATDEENQNPQSISVSQDAVFKNNDSLNIDGNLISPLLNTVGKKSIEGTVSKDISQYTGKIGFATLSSEIQFGTKALKLDGTFEDIPAPLTGYNQAMREQSTVSGFSGTVGAYLGLTQTQIDNGIFY